MKALLEEIKDCIICKDYLAAGCNPVVTASTMSKVIIIGQAPGRRVHESSEPWNDKSGDNLRKWLNVTKEQFYNTNNFALIPMGFCYPGKGKTGDLPPRPECAPFWHKPLMIKIHGTPLILLIGHYAQNYYLGKSMKSTLTETVRSYKQYNPIYFPLPHPSPRNNIWQKKNSWFATELLPQLEKKIHKIIK